MPRRAATAEAPVTNLILHTIRSNWCGINRPPLKHKYARVVGIEAPGDSRVTPTNHEYPVKGHVRPRRIQLPSGMVEKLQGYLTKWARFETASLKGSDEMLDFPFWMQTGEHSYYGATRDAAEKIMDTGQEIRPIYDRLGLGQIGVFGCVTPPVHLNNLQGAVLGLGDQMRRPHCLFGQDGIVGLSSLDAAYTNRQELALRRQLPDTIHMLKLFAEPGRP